MAFFRTNGTEGGVARDITLTTYRQTIVTTLRTSRKSNLSHLVILIWAGYSEILSDELIS